MCRGICAAKFTWVGSKCRPGNKMRTRAGAWTFKPLWSQSLTQFEIEKSGGSTWRPPARHTASQRLRSSVLVSPLVDNNIPQLCPQWKPEDGEMRRPGRCINDLCCCYFLSLFFLSSPRKSGSSDTGGRAEKPAIADWRGS